MALLHAPKGPIPRRPERAVPFGRTAAFRFRSPPRRLGTCPTKSTEAALAPARALAAPVWERPAPGLQPPGSESELLQERLSSPPPRRGQFTSGIERPPFRRERLASRRGQFVPRRRGVHSGASRSRRECNRPRLDRNRPRRDATVLLGIQTVPRRDSNCPRRDSNRPPRGASCLSRSGNRPQTGMAGSRDSRRPAFCSKCGVPLQ